MEIVNDIGSLTQKILDKFSNHDKKTAFTIAISGIDASGKGYVAGILQDELEIMGYKVANINIDPWQNPIPVRLRKENAAENFYQNVFRWRDVFSKLLIPLKNDRKIELQAKLIRTHADEYYDHIYRYKEIDFLLIDGILLFQEEYLSFYDYRIWIDCSFETGLKRALRRNIEKLNDQQLIHDYETFYYPAQRFHFKKDKPADAADVIFHNDPVLSNS